jgi:hypothetical protein
MNQFELFTYFKQIQMFDKLKSLQLMRLQSLRMTLKMISFLSLL